jgi:hypothetical protein
MSLLAFLVACGGGPDPCHAADLASGSGEAEIDGADWNGTGLTWSPQGSSIQVSGGDGSFTITLVARTSTDGVTADEAMAGSFDLADGGFATVYPSSGASYRSASGTLDLGGRDGDDLLGCFAFDASGDDGEVSVTSGRFRAAP